MTWLTSRPQYKLTSFKEKPFLLLFSRLCVHVRVCVFSGFMLNTPMRTDAAFNHLFTESGSPLLIYQSRFSLRQNVNMCFFSVWLSRVHEIWCVSNFSMSPGPRMASPYSNVSLSESHSVFRAWTALTMIDRISSWWSSAILEYRK